MPLVSVIMNCRNCGKYLREALDSVYEQTFKDYEIVFWDNMSDDESAQIALSYGEPLRYFRGEEFVPLGAARNKAIEKAHGRYIAFLDCDDIWLPDKLEKQVELLESDERLGLTYSDCLLIDEKGNPKTDIRYHISRFEGNVFDRLLDLGGFIPMPTVIIRKEALNNVGPFNPELEIVEEYDLWIRIAECYLVGFIEKPLAKYRKHGENISENLEAACDESFQIIEYWTDKKPELKKWRGPRIRKRKAMLHFTLLQFYFRNNKTKQALREVVNLIMLLPHSLTIIVRILKVVWSNRNGT